MVGARSAFGDVEITAAKPKWEAGAAVAIALKPRATATAPAGANAASTASVAPAAAPATATPAKKWTLSAADMSAALTANDEDEDALLAREQERVIIVTPSAAGASDCGTSAAGAKKACKDCSCGLADEQAGGGNGGGTAVAKSACGSVRGAPLQLLSSLSCSRLVLDHSPWRSLYSSASSFISVLPGRCISVRLVPVARSAAVQGGRGGEAQGVSALNGIWRTIHSIYTIFFLYSVRINTYSRVLSPNLTTSCGSTS